MTRTFTAVVVVLAATVIVSAAKIETHRSKTFDFSRLKTWDWSPAGPGDVMVVVTAESKSEPVEREYEPVIMRAAENALTRRGYTKSSGGTPDFVLSYYVLITAASQSHEIGQFLPATSAWALPPFTAQTQSLRVYPQGTLVFDVASPDKDNIVWRAVTQAEIELQRTSDKRAARLTQIINEVLAKLPRK
jgi:hypothetical protein